MKRLLVLKTDYLDLDEKKINKINEQKMRDNIADKSLKEFKSQAKELINNKLIKIIKEYSPEAWVIIECLDKDFYGNVYEAMCKMDVVQTIETVQPSDEK